MSIVFATLGADLIAKPPLAGSVQVEAKLIHRPVLQSDGGATDPAAVENSGNVPCFASGTLIETKDGLIPVEAIEIGQKVMTRDNGYRMVRWVGRRDLTAADLVAEPALMPVRIRRGALGNGFPAADMLVAQQQRMLLTGVRTEQYFGETEVLVAAADLVGQPGIARAEVKEVSFIQIMFDAHEIILAAGAWSESFQPDDLTLRGLDSDQRAEIFTLFPELAFQCGRDAYQAARLRLKPHEVDVLLAA